MDGKITQIEKDGRTVCIYLPEKPEQPLPVLYMLAGPEPGLELSGPVEHAEKAAKRGECRPFAAVAVGCRDWNSAYTPWPAPPLFDSEPPFTGGAAETIRWLTRELLPFAEAQLPAAGNPEGRAILGYSLAGLTALHTLYLTDEFGACGCCSGSLWFDGWPAFMASHHPRTGSRIYLSLGKNEEKAKNPRTAVIGDITRTAHACFLNDPGVTETALIWHDGGHFSSVAERITKAMIWLSC